MKNPFIITASLTQTVWVGEIRDVVNKCARQKYSQPVHQTLQGDIRVENVHTALPATHVRLILLSKLLVLKFDLSACFYYSFQRNLTLASKDFDRSTNNHSYIAILWCLNSFSFDWQQQAIYIFCFTLSNIWHSSEIGNSNSNSSYSLQTIFIFAHSPVWQTLSLKSQHSQRKKKIYFFLLL